MRVLVTGSSGTIGTRLCERLLKRGDDVIGIDWRKNEWQPSVEERTLRIDLRDMEALKAQSSHLRFQTTDGQAKLKADVIVHLAANARVYDLVADPDRARDNMLTTYNILEFARKSEIPRLMFASSRETYGNAKADLYDESKASIDLCESPYTASKIAGEALVHAYRRCYGIGAIIARFSNVYGMYDSSDRVVPLFIRKCLKGEPLQVFGKDKCLDFTYIDDTVTGILCGIEHFEEARGGTYNIASGRGTTLVKLAETVKAMTESSSAISIGENRTGEVIRFVADISKAKKILGFEPKVPFEEGITKAVEWYRTRD